MKTLNRNTSHTASNRPIKVLQFGKGNFLRGYIDWMIDILNEKASFHGDIQIIESSDNGLAKILNEQDGLYHVLLEGLQNGEKIQEPRLITCVKGVINPADDYKTFLKLGKNPNLEFIISNTTEAGIRFDDTDTYFDTLPNSFPGKLTALLYYRFLHFKDANKKNLTIIPCELIERNGDTLKEVILKYIELWELPDGFLSWVHNTITFCNTLVDRIVPGFPKEELETRLGFKDQMAVKAEPFHLLVIEAPNDVQKMFPAETAGLNVKFVKDLTPYRTRKVRILNGAHTAMVPFGYLHGIDTVREAVEHPATAAFVKQIIFDEIIPTLDLPKEELTSFAVSVIERFRNPFIRHELISIALNSVSKFKVRVLPSLLTYYEKEGELPAGLVRSFAYLIVFYKGWFEGKAIPLKDDLSVIAFFTDLWKTGDIDHIVTQTLSKIQFWETDLTIIKGLKEQIILEIQQVLSNEILIKK